MSCSPHPIALDEIAPESSESSSSELGWKRLSDGEELANAITHGAAAAGALVAAVLVVTGQTIPLDKLLGFIVYASSLVLVFLLSTISHVVTDPRRLDLARAWDQGAIYCLIAGTYTPGVIAFSDGWVQAIVLALIWSLALIGFVSKVVVKHLVHSIDTWTYIALGWVPAMILAPRVPGAFFLWMLGGGIAYTIGVVFLINDQRVRFFHAMWHLLVIVAAGIHFYAIAAFTV